MFRLSNIIKRLKETNAENISLPHKIHNDVLYFWTDEKKYLIEVPNSMILSVLDLYHNSFLTGHPGKERLLYGIKEKHIFPNMDKLAEEFVKRCSSCLEIKGQYPPLTKIGEYP